MDKSEITHCSSPYTPYTRALNPIALSFEAKKLLLGFRYFTFSIASVSFKTILLHTLGTGGVDEIGMITRQTRLFLPAIKFTNSLASA